MSSTARTDQLDFLGVRARILTDPSTDPQSLGIVEVDMPPGDMPPLHVHHNEDEGFYVLEGELTLFLPDREIRLEAGDFALAPRGIPHAYRAGEAGTRGIVTSSPAGFERFVSAVASLEEPTPEIVTAVAADHGIEILGPPGARP